jgi:hypothetical protein
MAPASGDSALQSAVLEGLSDARHYRRWLADLARPHLGAHPIEVGSGIGDYATEWLPQVQRFTATEADENRLVMLKERFAGDPKVEVRAMMLPHDEQGAHTAAVGLNVMEHVEDDVAGFRSLANLVQPGGAVVVVVPAFPSAMSRFDRSIGHFRRYTVRSAREAMQGAGLRVEHVRYVNPLGLLNWYVAVKLLGLVPKNGALLRAYDRLAVPPSRWLETHIRPAFGQSVFAVGRVTD